MPQAHPSVSSVAEWSINRIIASLLNSIFIWALMINDTRLSAQKLSAKKIKFERQLFEGFDMVDWWRFKKVFKFWIGSNKFKEDSPWIELNASLGLILYGCYCSIVVSTSDCGSENPGSNPGSGNFLSSFLPLHYAPCTSCINLAGISFIFSWWLLIEGFLSWKHSLIIRYNIEFDMATTFGGSRLANLREKRTSGEDLGLESTQLSI